MLHAIYNDCNAYKYVGPKLKKDPRVLCASLDDPKDICDIVKFDYNYLLFVNPKYRDNETVVNTAINVNGLALEYASSRLKNDYITVQNAVSNNGLALEYASPNLQNDDAIVIKAVGQNGLALEYASPRLKNTYDAVMSAVNQNGLALMFASKRLQNKDAIVMCAVNNNGLALHYASERLQDEDIVVSSAIKNNFFAFEYVSPRIKKDKDIIYMIVSEIITGRSALNPSSVASIIKPIISNLDTEKLAKNNSPLEVIGIALKTIRNELEKEENITDEKHKVKVLDTNI